MDIKEIDKSFVAGTYKRFPVEIVDGHGSLVRDEKGREYIDMGSGIGVTSFGIADDVWREAITEQIGRVQHMSNLYYTEPCAKLAKILCERTGMSKVFFSNSGAESNECAIKILRKYAADKHGAGRFTIATLVDSFHGRTLTTLAATGQDHYHELFQPLTPGFVSVPAGDIAALERADEKTPIAGVLLECVQGEGGVIAIDGDYIRAVRDFCTKRDILMAIDEVQTGNGRTGQLYAYMNFGIEPDVVSTAKGLAGGLPLGATLMAKGADSVLGFGDHGSTFGGNPVCCAAALSIISRIDDALLADVRAKSKFIFDELTGAPGVESVSGLGMMIGVKTKRPAPEIIADCIEHGVLCLSAKDKIRLLPALNIPRDLLERAIKVIKEVIAK